jgi:hypothetical protein
VQFYRLSWARARETVLAKGEIVSYRMLVGADTGSRSDVALQTTFADSAAFARVEEIFRRHGGARAVLTAKCNQSCCRGWMGLWPHNLLEEVHEPQSTPA